jgi:hypothetical protein
VTVRALTRHQGLSRPIDGPVDAIRIDKAGIESRLTRVGRGRVGDGGW